VVAVASASDIAVCCYDPVVDEDSFWALVTECREQAGDDTELTSRVIFRRVRALSPADVEAFARHWEHARSSLYSWPVADAAPRRYCWHIPKRSR
jgi:hypothetical protein